jgi:hypothetical protein
MGWSVKSVDFPQYFMQFQEKPTFGRYSGVVETCGKHTVIGWRFFRESTLLLPDREGKKIVMRKGRTVF